MQPTEHCLAMHGAEAIKTMTRLEHWPRYSGWRIRHARSERHVRATAIVMSDPRSQDTTHVRFRERYDPVQTLAPDRADYPLADPIRHRAASRRLQHAKPKAAN